MRLTALNFFCLLLLAFSYNRGYAQPANNAISGAVQLTSGVSPTSSSGNFYNGAAATGTTSMNTFCSVTSSSADVWYYFIARSTFPTIALSNIGTGTTSLSTGNVIQVFNTNSTNSTIINSITASTLNNNSVGCVASTSGTTNSLTPTSSLTIGNIYLVRLVSNATPTSTTSRWGFTITVSDPLAIGGRTGEVFSRTTLSSSGTLQYPWEITYGSDDKLWITEARGYKVYRMDPSTGVKTTVLDLNSTSTDLNAWGADSLRAVSLSSQSNWNSSANNWPQGGLAGLALHPDFGDGSHDFVYIAYVHRYLSTATSSGGIFFRNKIVRFTYNSSTGKLGSPAVLCDTLPGGQDHNSQRMIIAPVTPGGTNYLFYASGDMGGGQYSNRNRPIKAQNINSYEGKILRFNLEPDSDGGVAVPNAWIPDDNPYNTSLGVQSAVYSIGIRNNQGFAYDKSLNILYGSSHGAFSDDEINIIEAGKNYGHPLVIGYDDGNYDGITAGSAPGMGGSSGSAPLISDEAHSADSIGVAYRNPLFSAYTTPTPVSPTNYTTVNQLWNGTNGSTNIWPSEAWSGLDIYTHTLIPGWNRSLIASGLKWGRLIRLKLGSTGTTTLPSNLAYGNTNDTITYFQSTNRYRDLAFAPNGKDVFIVMDNNAATSGPGVGNPIVPACGGCVIKYTFLGYADNSARSSIPSSIDITTTNNNSITNGTTITIDATNNNLWVPITGPDGNILAEIKANGNNLGNVTSSFYTSSSVRETAAKKLYLNRSITITPQNQPSSAVNVRLYITTAEFTALKNALNSQGAGSGVSAIGDLKIFKNDDTNPSVMTASATAVASNYAESHTGTSTGGYVLEGSITSFSSFYFGSGSLTTLPASLLTFKGSLKNNATLLKWETSNESNTSHFEVERSVDGSGFDKIGSVLANGNSTVKLSYSFTDEQAANQSSSTIYYRLKLVDKDGVFKYSEIVPITLEALTGINVYPNPIEDVVNIRFKSLRNNRVIVQVTDIHGRIVYYQTKQVNEGLNNLKIDTRAWSAQSYTIQIVDSDQKILTTKKVVKL